MNTGSALKCFLEKQLLDFCFFRNYWYSQDVLNILGLERPWKALKGCDNYCSFLHRKECPLKKNLSKRQEKCNFPSFHCRHSQRYLKIQGCLRVMHAKYFSKSPSIQVTSLQRLIHLHFPFGHFCFSNFVRGPRIQVPGILLSSSFIPRKWNIRWVERCKRWRGKAN